MICGPAKFECYSKAKNDIFQNGVFQKCQCLPSCNSLSYTVDTSTADYDLVAASSKSLIKYDLSK